MAYMLTASTRIGPYEIVALLGTGGMGEVYRARDTRLGREVAIKVLPALYASNPDRLARVALPASTELETGPLIPAQTVPGAILGTIGYMSPEQLRDLPTDARSDLFALGCVLYELVAGKRLFQRRTAAETAAAILRDEAPPLGSIGTDLPPEVEGLIGHCLAKEIGKRVAS